MATRWRQSAALGLALALAGHGARAADGECAASYELAQHAEQLCHLPRGQHGGGFVENQYVASAPQHLENLDALLFADGELANQRIGPVLDSQAFGQRSDVIAHLHGAGIVSAVGAEDREGGWQLARSAAAITVIDVLAALRGDVRERGVCVLWATHWVEEAANAQRVLVLHKGSLLADGTPDEVTLALGAPTLEAGFIQSTR